MAEPEASEEAVLAATGRGWDEWCDIIDAWPGNGEGHTAIAAYLRDELGIDGWWSQSVTLGYERITGRRLRHQQPDGTFTANRTKTVTADPDELRQMLLDDAARSDLFPGLSTELRSRRSAKTVRVAIGPGVALVSFEPRSGGRVTVSISHERLPSSTAAEEWKSYWGQWLAAIDEG